MVRKRLNPNASPTNAFYATTAGSREHGKVYKSTRQVATLTAMVFPNSKGETVSLTFSPAKATWKDIKSAIEVSLENAGYVLDVGFDSGVKVIPDGSNFNLEIRGEVMITSFSGGAATVVEITDKYL